MPDLQGHDSQQPWAGRDPPHALHDIDGVGQVRQRLDVSASQQQLIRGNAGPGPFCLELGDVARGEVHVESHALRPAGPQLVREHQHRTEEERAVQEQQQSKSGVDGPDRERPRRDGFCERGALEDRERDDIRSKPLVHAFERPQAPGAIGVARDKVEVESGDAPDEPAPERQLPESPEQQEAEDGQARVVVGKK
jgi:hypothetical protein